MQIIQCTSAFTAFDFSRVLKHTNVLMKMSVLEIRQCKRAICIREICVSERGLYWRDVFIREMSVLERCLY